MFAAVSKRGFTLIELLVVITIIGILATGSVAVYTSQIQKSRDVNRMNDMKAIESGVEQYYQDNSAYPATTSFTGIQVYVPKLPKDPKSGQVCSKWNVAGAANATACDYIYNVGNDLNGILNGEYKISIGMENTANVNTKSFNDGGNEPIRFEIGLDLSNGKSTVCDRLSAVPTGTALTTGTVPSLATCDKGGTSGIFIAN